MSNEAGTISCRLRGSDGNAESSNGGKATVICTHISQCASDYCQSQHQGRKSHVEEIMTDSNEKRLIISRVNTQGCSKASEPQECQYPYKRRDGPPFCKGAVLKRLWSRMYLHFRQGWTRVPAECGANRVMLLLDS